MEGGYLRSKSSVWIKESKMLKMLKMLYRAPNKWLFIIIATYAIYCYNQ